jgi:poly(A) polymerase
LAENLRLSRNEAHEIARIKDEIGSTNRAAALGWLLGPSLALDVLLLRAVVFEQAFDWDQKSEIERGVASRFPVTAADLMPELSGPALGHGLARMKSRWLASELSLTRAELLQGPFPL